VVGIPVRIPQRKEMFLFYRRINTKTVESKKQAGFAHWDRKPDHPEEFPPVVGNNQIMFIFQTKG
jgi:hypothetical protein